MTPATPSGVPDEPSGAYGGRCGGPALSDMRQSEVAGRTDFKRVVNATAIRSGGRELIVRSVRRARCLVRGRVGGGWGTVRRRRRKCVQHGEYGLYAVL